MAKINETIIPLAQQPEYKAAISKVVEISRALTATIEKLEEWRARFIEAQHNLPSPPGLIDRALALAGGALRSENQPVVTMTTEMERLEAERKELHDGLTAANEAANEVACRLAAEIGANAKGRHVAAVAHILECLEALCVANKAECEVRESLEKLGYDRHRLTHQAFGAIGQINDPNELACRYAKEARHYINTNRKA